MTIIDNVKIGQRIKNQRKFLGLTQQSIYDKLNISQNHYSRIENGHTGMSFELLVDLSEILKLSTDYILTGKMAENGKTEFMATYEKLSTHQQNFINVIMKYMLEFDIK